MTTALFKRQVIDLLVNERVRDEVTIAARLGRPQREIHAVLQMIRDDWRENAQDLFDLYMHRQLAEIEAMKDAVFDWAIGRKQVTVTDPADPKKKRRLTLPASLNAIATMLKLMEREARLMGLDRQPLPPPPDGGVGSEAFDLSRLSTAELLTLKVIRLKMIPGTVEATPMTPDATGAFVVSNGSQNGSANGGSP